jgi:hypothetical protein
VEASVRRLTPPRLPLVAGIAFSLSWIIGLGIWSSSTKVGMSGEEVLRVYAGHEGIALAQFAFTEGLPALAFATVMLLLGRRISSGGQVGLGRVVGAAAVAAAVLSLAQFGLGAYLCLAAAPAGDAAAAKASLDAIGRADGAKMLLMALFSLASFIALRRAKGLLPGFLQPLALALAATILASGIGYLFLLDSLSIAAYLSLPLLLAWITSVGVALALRKG